MEMILISNAIRFNQSFEDFTKNFKNKYSAFGMENVFMIPKSVLSRIGKEKFKDEPLSKNESEEMKSILENKVTELLKQREPYKKGEGVYVINFSGEEIEIDPRPTGHNDSDHLIWKLYNLIEIIDSCLNDDKPIYLSITDDNN
ncbi:hypothetical protein IW15_22380 [Chryseobacterium soli]|uniref:Uncharacterized protein n=1 Tax=Chryseobacterium soli TaxID=445961 RepID=A0A085ZZD6_9FLAO|nr:hypothetical protein [Chryseobacterium soli]KFF09800.1 hypothetical protein IW15_22380 [Chryseobacterium soli]